MVIWPRLNICARIRELETSCNNLRDTITQLRSERTRMALELVRLTRRAESAEDAVREATSALREMRMTGGRNALR